MEGVVIAKPLVAGLLAVLRTFTFFSKMIYIFHFILFTCKYSTINDFVYRFDLVEEQPAKYGGFAAFASSSSDGKSDSGASSS